MIMGLPSIPIPARFPLYLITRKMKVSPIPINNHSLMPTGQHSRPWHEQSGPRNLPNDFNNLEGKVGEYKETLKKDPELSQLAAQFERAVKEKRPELLFGLDELSSRADFRKQYLNLSQKLHPDKRKFIISRLIEEEASEQEIVACDKAITDMYMTLKSLAKYVEGSLPNTTPDPK
jgi:hypothetical protein